MKKIRLIMLVAGAMILAACKKEKESSYEVVRGSAAVWKGYLETGYFNSGTVEIRGGGFLFKNDRITGGEVQIPISSIIITNQLSDLLKAELKHHLQSPDFFNMVMHPNVTYSVRTADKMASADADGNNYLIKGNLQLLGKSLPLEIPAKLEIFATVIKIQSGFKFDRTKWGLIYASDSTLPPGDKIKNDIEVALDFNISKY